jgi:hypothetical protein
MYKSKGVQVFEATAVDNNIVDRGSIKAALLSFVYN